MKNDSLSVYIDILIEKNTGVRLEEIPQIENVKPKYIPTLPVDHTIDKNETIWNWDEEVGNIYNRV